MITLFSVIILIISIIFHEVAHGTVADALGDPTARLSGRLTLNPLPHIDLVGSILLPLLCVISGTGFFIGWAKPVPFNPRLLKYKRWGPALVALAGPLVNIVIAAIFTIAFRVIGGMAASGAVVSAGAIALAQIFSIVVMVNISLAIFNLIPIPPLDGHHLLGAVFPSYRRVSEEVLQKYGIIILVFVLFFAGQIISPVISFFARLLLGA